MDFREMLEPIELIEPLGMAAEVPTGPVIKCDKGYVCNTGSVEL